MSDKIYIYINRLGRNYDIKSARLHLQVLIRGLRSLKIHVAWSGCRSTTRTQPLDSSTIPYNLSKYGSPFLWKGNPGQVNSGVQHRYDDRASAKEIWDCIGEMVSW